MAPITHRAVGFRPIDLNPTHPGSANHRSRVHDPSTSNVIPIIGSIDLVQALDDHRERYNLKPGEDPIHLSILSMPRMCLLAIQTIKTRTAKSAGSHIVLTAALAIGCDILRRNIHIGSLLRYKSAFDLLSTQFPAEQIELLDAWFRGFQANIELPGVRQNIKLPPNIHNELSGIAADLGLHTTSLGVYSILIALSAQNEDNVNAELAKRMKELTDKFFRTAELRARSTRALMHEFAMLKSGE